MWLCLNNAFLSIVDKSTKSGCLLVRSRRRNDIRKVFPTAKVSESFGTDYRFRADIPREVVAEAVANQIRGIEYNNFKNSVDDDRLHAAYNRVWGVMGQLQPGGPYASRARREPEFPFDDGRDFPVNYRGY